MSLEFDTFDIDVTTKKDDVNNFLKGCQMFFIIDLPNGKKRIWASFRYDAIDDKFREKETIN